MAEEKQPDALTLCNEFLATLNPVRFHKITGGWVGDGKEPPTTEERLAAAEGDVERLRARVADISLGALSTEDKIAIYDGEHNHASAAAERYVVVHPLEEESGRYPVTLQTSDDTFFVFAREATAAQAERTADCFRLMLTATLIDYVTGEAGK